MGLDERITLNNGILMPKFGLGVYKAGDATIRAVRTALECGYRLIDTANAYMNEAAVGKAMKRAMEEGIVKREEIFLSTKLWPTL